MNAHIGNLIRGAASRALLPVLVLAILVLLPATAYA